MKPGLAFILLLFQIVLIILYSTVCEFNFSRRTDGFDNISYFYPQFQDVHVMIFIGFGFLMVFLKYHSWSSVGFNFLVAAFVIQIVPLFTGMWEKQLCDQDSTTEPCPTTIVVDGLMLIRAEFGAGAVLITMGGLLGKVTEFQLIFISIIEILFYTLNEYIGIHKLKISDIGGSMVIHTFGAVFGVTVSRVFSFANSGTSKNAKDSTTTNMVAMVGTIFLFMYWPSFNSATGQLQTQRERAVINTYFSIAGSVVTTFLVSSMLNHGKLKMEDALNATLAGGVVIGSIADMLPNMGLALLIGAVAGIVSTIGFNKLTPWLSEKQIMHDTCGITNLHGIPGIMSGILSAIVASGLHSGSLSPYDLKDLFSEVANGRTMQRQAGFQMLFLIITIGLALGSGIVAGYLIKLKVFGYPRQLEDMFHDKFFWHGEFEIESSGSQVDLQTETNQQLKKNDQEKAKGGQQHNILEMQSPKSVVKDHSFDSGIHQDIHAQLPRTLNESKKTKQF